MQKTVLITALAILLCFFPVFLSTSRHTNVPGNVDLDYLKALNECTTGLASGLVTPDGRPLLWKTRDCGDSRQEFHYVDNGEIPFISVTYANEDDEYYGGINAEGFAIENSNCYNKGFGVMRNGWGGSDDDGEIHLLALSTCRTVDDFQSILDSLHAHEGITLPSNYGCFDAFGGAAMFETGAWEYTRYDAAETEDGFIVRSNFGYSGRLNNPELRWGMNRHDRAYALWRAAAEADILTPRYIYQQIVRNLHVTGMEDYSLPYDGFYGDYPYGYIPHSNTVCRTTTRSVMIAQGVLEGERPDNSMIWAMAGSPLGCITTPLWVRAGSVPSQYDDSFGSEICTLAVELKDYAIEDGAWGRAVDTWNLINPEGTGFWDWSLRIENMVFDRVEAFRNSDNFDFDQLESFQNLIARQVCDTLRNWQPPQQNAEIAEMIFWDNHLQIAWEPPDRQRVARDLEVDHYNIYRSLQPFRENNRGELIGTSLTEFFTEENPPESMAFYRVEAVY